MIAWATVAAELARFGLGRLGQQIENNPGGRVVMDVARALNTEPTPEAVQTALVSDPAAVEKLMAYQMALLEFDEASRQAAREANNTSRFSTAVPAVLAVLLLLIVIAFGSALFTQDIPERNHDMLNIMLGAILGWAGATVTYWVGSSRGSTSKEQILEQTLRK